jgi:hypothetical protein
MKPRAARTALLLPAIAVAAVVGLALPGPVAMAQTGPGAKSGKTENKAAASKPGSVGGVTVQAPRRSALQKIPPDKAAGFDQEAADAEAWKGYRKSTPRAAEGTLGQAKDYPGLHKLAPH